MESKKTKEADLESKKNLFFNIGMTLSLVLIITAFEWRQYERSSALDLIAGEDEFEELTDIPITEQPPPPPPKIQQPEIIEIPDEEEIEEEIEIDIDVEVTEEDVVEDIIIEDEPEEEVADEVFQIVEEYPEPPGGMQAFFKYVANNIEYPKAAKRANIQGKVYVQFVVDKDGSITNVQVMKGIGGGCDEEAVRIVSSSKKWSPGKQRGRPVKVKRVLPIVFKLSK